MKTSVTTALRPLHQTILGLCALSLTSLPIPAMAAATKSNIFSSGFDGDSGTKKWSVVYGAELLVGEQAKEHARSGDGVLKTIDSEASIRTQFPLTEQGTLEFWVKPQSAATQYKVTVRVASKRNDDSAWETVGVVEGSGETSDYYAKRISIDDPGKKFLRLDIQVTNGNIWLDDVRVEKILLDTALQKNQQKVISEVLDKLRVDKDYEVQADALRALGISYAAQIDVQRQYLEYANGIYSSVTLVLATSERSKMANPLAYQTFKTVVDDAKRVSSPIQKSRMESLLKPLGDITTTSLNIMTNNTYAAFAEPFKTIVATVFDKSSYENADLDRKDRKFAKKNGLKTFSKADAFLSEIEKELNTVTNLDKDLIEIQKDLDKYRKDLDKQLKEALIDGGLGRGKENYSRVMSKDESTRNAALLEITNYFLVQAESFANHTSSNTEFLQFMMKASSHIEESQVFKERFNQIASSVITYYDKFDRSIAADQNPFTDDKDRSVWESRAVKVRAYIQESKSAFMKAYM